MIFEERLRYKSIISFKYIPSKHFTGTFTPHPERTIGLEPSHDMSKSKSKELIAYQIELSFSV